MKDRLVREVWLWGVWGGVLGGLGYSTVVGGGQPVYASSSVCEPEDCAIVEQAAQGYCMAQGHGGASGVVCPLSSTPPGNNLWVINCNDGTILPGDCTNF